MVLKRGEDAVLLRVGVYDNMLYVRVRGASPSKTFTELVEGINSLIVERFVCVSARV